MSPRRPCMATLARVVVLSTFALSTHAFADDAPVMLEPVVVTAARHVEPLADTPANVTVIDAADLARDAALPVEDILLRRAGIALGRTGGAGQQASLFLRGSESDHVLVLIDGLRINSTTISGANLQHLRGADVQRIEVVRGPRSTLYGAEAIGGVVSITTRRAAGEKRGEQFTLQGEGGSDGSVLLQATATHRDDGSDVSFSAGRQRTDGDTLVDGIPVRGAHDNTSHAFNASTRAGSARVGIDALEDRGNTQYLNTSAGTPLHQSFTRGTLALWASAPLADTLQLAVRAGQAGERIEQRESPDYLDSRRRSAEATLTRDTGTNTLVAGVEAAREDARAIIYGLPTNDADDSRALFLRDEVRAGRHRFSVGARASDYDSFGRHDTGETSYGLDIGAHAFGWLAWGRGFHAPTAVDRYGYGGNPALAPETSESFEAGLRHRAGALTLTATGFRQDIDQLMLCVALPPPSWDCVMRNVASARITGTELGASWQGDDRALDVFVTLLDPVDTATGETLSRRPEKQLAASARQRFGAVELRAGVTAMGRRDNSAFDTLTLPGFAVIDVGASWTVRPGLAVDARVDNAGDRDYVLAASGAGPYRQPGRAAFLGVTWTPGAP